MIEPSPTDAELDELGIPRAPALFIGGIADGRTIPDPKESIWQIMDYAESPNNPDYFRTVSSAYRRETIRNGNDHAVIYVLNSMDTFYAIQQLIRGYSPHTEQ